MIVGDVGAGHTLGRYELLVPIAQGGMAVVWAARLKGKRRFQKIVALKSMLPALSDDPMFERMFLSEAELASRIKHPNVCEILDLGEEDGTLFIVMEWIDGDPLSILRRAAKQHGGVPAGVVARIGSASAAGLHAAHELTNDDGELVGLVHRDVSPQNILVTPQGVVKIVDFGVAKATAAADVQYTRAGQVKGKVPFMAPEQALGRKVDRRTDIFALGIVLYLLSAGKHPFKLDNDIATLKRICDKEPAPSPSQALPSFPKPLERVLLKALEKDPDKRYETMRELRAALDEATAEIGGESDLADFVTKVLGERSKKRGQAIQRAIAVADERLESGAGAGGAPRAVPTLDLGDPGTDDKSGDRQGSGGSSHAEASDARLEPRIETELTDYQVPMASNRSSWVAVIVVLLLGAGVAFLIATSTPEPRPPIPVPEASPGAAPSAKP